MKKTEGLAEIKEERRFESLSGKAGFGRASPASYKRAATFSAQPSIGRAKAARIYVSILLPPARRLLPGKRPGYQDRLGGRQLAEQLATRKAGMKVLYLSGYTDDAVFRHGVLEAEVAFLQKPFTTAALANKVREVLDS